LVKINKVRIKAYLLSYHFNRPLAEELRNVNFTKTSEGDSEKNPRGYVRVSIGEGFGESQRLFKKTFGVRSSARKTRRGRKNS